MSAGSRRYGKPLSLGMLDVNHSKSINDGFGHEAGDEALIAIDIAITNEIRQCRMAADPRLIVPVPAGARSNISSAGRAAEHPRKSPWELTLI